jgi:hypothetical protein
LVVVSSPSPPKWTVGSRASIIDAAAAGERAHTLTLLVACATVAGMSPLTHLWPPRSFTGLPPCFPTAAAAVGRHRGAALLLSRLAPAASSPIPSRRPACDLRRERKRREEKRRKGER